MRAPAAAAPRSPAATPSRGSALRDRAPLVAAVVTFAAHAACGGRYGLFRDELYFLVCGERLAPGYVDQPPGVALVARLAHALFGTWVPGIRLPGWIATAVTVWLAGRLARRLSAAPAAPLLASVATAACLVLRGTAHFMSMNAFEPLLVLALVHLLVRLAEGEDPRLWVAAGAVAGLAVLFKYSAASTSLALLAGFALSPARGRLWTRWALAGALVGALAVLPNLAWQASHGFPFAELVQNGLRYKNALTSPGRFLLGVLVEANPVTAPLWLGGLAWLLVGRAARSARFAGIGLLVALAALALGHGKSYYAAPLLPPLLAAGGAALAPRLGLAGARVGVAVMAVVALLALPMAVPILPPRAFLAYARVSPIAQPTGERRRLGVMPQVFADQFGWPALVDGVAAAWRALPPEQQATAVVFGQNYGVASAVEILGPARRIPPGVAVSGHDSFWFWGLPAGRGDPAIVVSGEREDCAGGFYRERVRAARIPHDPYVMPDEDAHVVWICRGARGPIPGLPPQARRFD